MMSGSGGSGWSQPNEDSCERLVSITTLTSPVHQVVTHLQVGDQLDVELDNSEGVRIVRALRNGHVAGSITSAIIQKIADCIDGGHQYVAEVLSVEGGAIRVRVSHRE